MYTTFDDLSLVVKLAEISYYDETTILNYLSNYSTSNIKFFKSKTTFGFGVRFIEFNKVFLVFRGTVFKGLFNVLSNLATWPKFSKIDNCYLHYGFLYATNSIYYNVKTYINKLNTDNITCVGHSQGGSIATIMSLRLKAKELITFGCPRVGMKNLSRLLYNNKTRPYRVVNNNDIVPYVPIKLLGYKHYGNTYYINFYGEARPYTFKQRYKDIIRGNKRALQKHQIFDWLFDHGILMYCKKLRGNND